MLLKILIKYTKKKLHNKTIYRKNIMPISSLFAYNSGSTITGTTQIGQIALGLDHSTYYDNLDNIEW